MKPWTYGISPDRRQALIVDDEGFTVAEIAGHDYYRNRSGLCEDAPCCGCCNF